MNEHHEAIDLAWDLLWQGAGVGGGREQRHYIDHKTLAIYEEACDFFSRLGWLSYLDGREYIATDSARLVYPEAKP